MRQARISINQAAARVRADPDAPATMMSNLPPAPAGKPGVSWKGWLTKEGERNIIGWPTRQRRHVILEDDNMSFYERVQEDGTVKGLTASVDVSKVGRPLRPCLRAKCHRAVSWCVGVRCGMMGRRVVMNRFVLSVACCVACRAACCCALLRVVVQCQFSRLVFTLADAGRCRCCAWQRDATGV